MIGIITFHCQYNFGSALQAYALQTTLEKLGHSNILINFYYKKDMKIYDVRWDSKRPDVILFDLLTAKKNHARKRAYHRFHNEFLRQTERTDDWMQLGSICRNMDILICGSDQIWNLRLVQGVHPAYYLRFAKPNQKRIAYAPSFAAIHIPEQYKDELKEALQDFSAISVRERSHAEELSSMLDRTVERTLDPALLLERKDYDVLLENFCVKLPKQYIFIYCLHHVNLKMVCKYAEKLAEEHNLKIVYFNKYDIHKRRYCVNIFELDPRAFVYAIKNAAFVVADSFHAAVFSIIYHKPFMSYSLDDTRNRLDSLYADLGITGHFIGESAYQPIEYNILDEKLALLRSDSLRFLMDALGGMA